ncbi:MAG: hypothetical protein HUU02_11880 [Bacteroidetes bacterium]|nr:hypothetical protein [Bacteroidota bacterium]
MRAFLLGVLCITMVPSLLPQQFLRSSSQPNDTNSAALRFERNVNTYLWNTRASYRYSDPLLQFGVKDNFTSNYIRGQSSSFRDEHTIAVNLLRSFSGPVGAAADIRSFSLSDRQTFGSSSAGIHAAALGLTVQPAPNISFTPMAGFRLDDQQGHRDNGLNLRFYVRGDSIETGEYRAAFDAQYNESDLGPRRHKNDHAVVRFATEFGEGAVDSDVVRWSLNRNDFYVPADSAVLREFGSGSNIRSRSEQVWGVMNTIAYQVTGRWFTLLGVDVESRTIDNAFRYKPLSVLPSIPFNTGVREFRIDGSAAVEYRSAPADLRLGFQMGERNEQHVLERIVGVNDQFQTERAQQESRLDNVAFRTALSGMVLARVTQDDLLSFSGSASLLQYDTPDTLNTDDRDELLVTLSLRNVHRFSEVLTAAVTVEATAAHIVYLSRLKSANNNWNRIIRLAPEVTYRPSDRFRMYNAFEVQANYTVFDFESRIPSVKSYSYRQVAFLDSTSYDMTERVGGDLTAYVRVFERGELRWSEFAERPLQRIEEVTVSPQLRFTPDRVWSFSAGFRSFAQKRFSYVNNRRTYESTFISAGPTTAVTARISSFSSLEVRGWKEFQRLSGGTIREYSNVSLNIRYLF